MAAEQEAGISLQGTMTFADAGQRSLTTAISPDLAASEACNDRRPVCQTGAQRVSGTGGARACREAAAGCRSDRAGGRQPVATNAPESRCMCRAVSPSSRWRTAPALRGRCVFVAAKREAGFLSRARQRSRMPAWEGSEDPRPGGIGFSDDAGRTAVDPWPWVSWRSTSSPRRTLG